MLKNRASLHRSNTPSLGDGECENRRRVPSKNSPDTFGSWSTLCTCNGSRCSSPCGKRHRLYCEQLAMKKIHYASNL